MKQTLTAVVLGIIALVGSLLWTTQADAQETYLIGVGDRLSVEVLEDPSLNRAATVLPDGRISFPLAGTISVAGRTISQVEAAITAAIAENFASEPQVFVSVQPRAPDGLITPEDREPRIRVYFLGEVGNPGVRNLRTGVTFLQAMAQAGNLSNFAATKRIQLRRTDAVSGQQQLYTINYKAILDGAAVINDFRLAEGDVIIVPERRLFE
ncbi:MAG: polysaccharide biosynthesis/export family protein [Pseudomonadota bacterium]